MIYNKEEFIVKDTEKKQLSNSEEKNISGGVKIDQIEQLVKKEKIKNYLKNNIILTATAYGGPGMFMPAARPICIDNLIKNKLKNDENEESTKKIDTSNLTNE